MQLTSAQRAVMAASLRDLHDLPWEDAIAYADCCADALNALEKRTIGEDRAQLETAEGWSRADEIGARQ